MSDLRFDGRVAIVTGAGNGLGRSHALLLAARGARVVVSDLGGGATGGGKSSAAADKVVEEIKAAGGEAVANYDSVEDGDKIVKTARDAFGRIDVLINNAGGMLGRVRIEDYSEEHLACVMALNVTQVAMFMRAVVPIMRAQKSGNIINVTSIAARHGGGGGAVLYAAAKGFISTATRGWAKEVVADGVRVNAVSPGVIVTPFHERYSTAEQLAAMQATIPMNRLGTPLECTGTFLYLASDSASSYVTGQVIEINGGQLMP